MVCFLLAKSLLERDTYKILRNQYLALSGWTLLSASRDENLTRRQFVLLLELRLTPCRCLRY